MLSDGVLLLRPIERADLPFLRDLANDPGVRENVVGWDWPLSIDGQERWFQRGVDSDHTRRFVVEHEGGGSIGVTGLWEIDWRNRNAMSAIKLGGAEDVRGRGYGTRAIRLMTDFAFSDAGLHRLYARILSFNEASLGLYRDKCGWTVEGTSRQQVWRGDRYWDLVEVGILRDEYLAQREETLE